MPVNPDQLKILLHGKPETSSAIFEPIEDKNSKCIRCNNLIKNWDLEAHYFIHKRKDQLGW